MNPPFIHRILRLWMFPRLDQPSCHAKSSLLRRQETKISIKIQANVKSVYCRNLLHPVGLPGRYRGLHRYFSTTAALSNWDVHTKLSRNRRIHTRVAGVPRGPVGSKKLRAESRHLAAWVSPWSTSSIQYGFAFRVQQPWSSGAKVGDGVPQKLGADLVGDGLAEMYMYASDVISSVWCGWMWDRRFGWKMGTLFPCDDATLAFFFW